MVSAIGGDQLAVTFDLWHQPHGEAAGKLIGRSLAPKSAATSCGRSGEAEVEEAKAGSELDNHSTVLIANLRGKHASASWDGFVVTHRPSHSPCQHQPSRGARLLFSEPPFIAGRRYRGVGTFHRHAVNNSRKIRESPSGRGFEQL